VELIKEIGSFAGLGAFLGLAILSLLYFSQARDVRRLREWAGRAPERTAEQAGETSTLAAQRAEEVRKLEEERRRQEEARQAEQRAAAKREERRKRREMGLPEVPRLERIRSRLTAPLGGRRIPEPRYLAVIIGGVIVLGAGVTVGALEILGGGDNGESKGPAAGAPLKPSETEVAVLNGTAVSGLAGRIGDQVEADGFELGAVTNSQNSFTESVVMFSRGRKPEAKVVARDLGIDKVRLMPRDIASVSAGADVAAVIGEDQAQFDTTG
jgi:hypothetical protein